MSWYYQLHLSGCTSYYFTLFLCVIETFSSKFIGYLNIFIYNVICETVKIHDDVTLNFILNCLCLKRNLIRTPCSRKLVPGSILLDYGFKSVIVPPFKNGSKGVYLKMIF